MKSIELLKAIEILQSDFDIDPANIIETTFNTSQDFMINNEEKYKGSCYYRPNGRCKGCIFENRSYANVSGCYHYFGWQNQDDILKNNRDTVRRMFEAMKIVYEAQNKFKTKL